MADYTQLIRAIRDLAADEAGKQFRMMSSVDNPADISKIITALTKHGNKIKPVELTNSDESGLHAFVIGVDGFKWPMNWYLG